MKDFLLKNKKKLIFGAIVLVLLAGAGIAVSSSFKSAPADTGVKEVTVEPGSISSTVTGKGNIEAGKEINITAPLGLMVDEVYVKSGDTVEVGQALADVQSSSVAGKLAEMIDQEDAVQDQLDTLDLDYLEREALEGQRENLRETISQLRNLHDYPVITAPQNGIIDNVYLATGEPISQHSASPSASDGQAGSQVSAAEPAVIKVSYFKTSPPVQMDAQEGQAGGQATALASAAVLDAQIIPQPMGGARQLSAPVAERIIDFSSLRIEAPVAGMAPQSALSQSPYFVGSLSWNCPGATFEPDTVYTATMRLTANPGYAFSSATLPDLPGCADDYEIVGLDGASGNSLTVTARFDATQSIPIGSPLQSSDGGALLGDASGGSYYDIETPSVGPSQDATAPEYYPSGGGYSSGDDGQHPGAGGEEYGASGGESPSASEAQSAEAGVPEGYEGASTMEGATSGTYAPGTVQVSAPAQGDSQSLVAADGQASPSLEFNTYDSIAFTMSSMDEIVVKIDVDERDILKISQGQQAVVKLDAIPGEEFPGTISRISGSAKPTDGTTKYSVDVSLNPDVRLKGGMSATVTITTGNNQNVLVIPIEAVQERDGTKFVYTTEDEEGNLGGEVNIKTGLANADYVEVTEGLTQGMIIFYKEPEASEDTGGEAGDDAEEADAGSAEEGSE